MIWTPVEDLIITANRGKLSAAQIADLIGHGITRNAVIGRSGRLGLVKLKSARQGRPKLMRDELMRARKPVLKEFVSPPVAVAPLNIMFADLEPFHCREIVGSDGPGRSLSCGHPVIHESSYCRWHHSINHYTRPQGTVRPLAA